MTTGYHLEKFSILLSLNGVNLHFMVSCCSIALSQLQNNSGGRGSGGCHPCRSDRGDHCWAFGTSQISDCASNNMTLSTGAIKYWEVQNNPGGRGVEVDNHVEVIEVIIVGRLVHIRISNLLQITWPWVKELLSTERCKITLGGGGVEVDFRVH